MRSSGDLGLQKVPTMNYSELTRTTVGSTDLDAKSCYDRILQPVAALVCYKYGLPHKFCQWFTLMLNLQKHYVIMSQGRSKESYRWTKKQQLHGIGQGSTAALIFWLLLSSTLFMSMRKWMQGITIRSHVGQHKVKRYSDSFVDDTTLWEIKQIPHWN